MVMLSPKVALHKTFPDLRARIPLKYTVNAAAR